MFRERAYIKLNPGDIPTFHSVTTQNLILAKFAPLKVLPMGKSFMIFTRKV